MYVIANGWTISRAIEMYREPWCKRENSGARGDVLDRIKNRFVLGNPRVWWLSFRFPPKEHHYDDDYQYKRISCFLNNEDFCYFIAELDVTHIFKARVADVVFIIGECSFFEYYVVSNGFEEVDLWNRAWRFSRNNDLRWTSSRVMRVECDTLSFRLSSQLFLNFSIFFFLAPRELCKFAEWDYVNLHI